jgi:diguanylate cyclase (GGDEF)-like protein
MGWGLFRNFLWVMTCALSVMLAHPAAAQGFAPGSTCHASAREDETAAALARMPERWICDNTGWSIDAPRTFVRIDLRGSNDSAALVYSSRLTDFAKLQLTVLAADGSSASQTYVPGGMMRATSDWIMAAHLPQTRAPPVAVIAAIDGARHPGMITDSRIITAKAWEQGNIGLELLIAAICGILCVPLIFNLMFYRVLRERFLLWHALAVCFMITHTTISSGLINRMALISFDFLTFLSAMSWGGGVIAAAMFAANVIEPGKLDPGHRLALRLLAPWIIGWSLVYLYAGGPLRPWAAQLYFGSYVPVLGLFVAIMGIAWRRGSRPVRFMVAAWMPIMVTGTLRVASINGLTAEPMELQLQQHIAIALEVIITSLGVADRFIVIRRQRDRARAEARLFENLSERDPLTGLLNRRTIEERFQDLFEDGFRTAAVIDVDSFKSINDNHGHALGDDVLRAMAGVFAADEESIAVRMGGEEFLLLLRGRDAAERAERMRRAISVRITERIPGLDQIVTASMGLVEHAPGAAGPRDFLALYRHCDRLLYEAKDAGRNRTMSILVRGFNEGRKSAWQVA